MVTLMLPIFLSVTLNHCSIGEPNKVRENIGGIELWFIIGTLVVVGVELLGTLTPPHPRRNFLYCLPSSRGQRFQLQDGGVGGGSNGQAYCSHPVPVASSLGLERLRWSPSGLNEELGR